MSKILVTGGAGFIGSNFVRYMVNKYSEYEIINLDALTYCGNLENLKDIEDKDAQLTDTCTKVSNLTKQLEKESGKVEEVKTKTEAAVTSIKKKLQTLNDGLGDEFNIFG